MDRLERAIMGYQDEGGVWVVGLLATVQAWKSQQKWIAGVISLATAAIIADVITRSIALAHGGHP